MQENARSLEEAQKTPKGKKTGCAEEETLQKKGNHLSNDFNAHFLVLFQD